MSRDRVVLLAVVACYAAAVPVIRWWMRKDDDIDPLDAFGLWMAWPLVLAMVIAMEIPRLLFPVPQVRKVKERLVESAGKKDEQ